MYSFLYTFKDWGCSGVQGQVASSMTVDCAAQTDRV